MTDQRRMPSTDLHDLLDEMSRRSGESAPPDVTDDPWPEDPWAEDEPISTPDATPQRVDQPTVVGHVFAASMQLAGPRGSNHRIAGPTAPTAAPAGAAAVVGAPVIRSSPGRSPSMAPPARLASASTPRVN